MALMRPIPPAGLLSGRLASVEFEIRHSSHIVKQSKTPRAHSTPRETNQRAKHAAAIAAWRSLTDTERATWNTLAFTNPRPNRLGLVSPRSGFQLFLAYFPFSEYLWPPYGSEYSPPPSNQRSGSPGLMLATYNNTTSNYIVGTTGPYPKDGTQCEDIWISRFAKSISRPPKHWIHVGRFPKTNSSTNYYSQFIARDLLLMQGEIVWTKLRYAYTHFWPSLYFTSAATVTGAP